MKSKATFAYRKISHTSVSLLSRDMNDDPEFALLIQPGEAVEDIRYQLECILQDSRIEDGAVTITIEAGR